MTERCRSPANAQPIGLTITMSDSRIDSLIAAANRAVAAHDYRLFGDLMLHELETIRALMTDSEWRDHVVPRMRSEVFYQVAQEDPFCARATNKPRGYAGDAELLDMLYLEDCAQPHRTNATRAGQQIHDYWMQSPAAKAVRWRRNYFQEQLAALNSRESPPPPPSVLCLASGHFREGDTLLGKTVRAQIHCIEQDALSHAHVASKWAAHTGMFAVNANVLSYVRDTRRHDLIYSAGLYDYLHTKLATRLSSHFVQRLLSGGMFCIANFCIGTPNRASMELLQDWWLTYRSPRDLESILVDAGAEQERVSSFVDPTGCIAYAMYCKPNSGPTPECE